MSKADKTNANNAIGSAQKTSDNLYGTGVAGAAARQASVQNTADSERNQIWSGYSGLANPTGGLTAEQQGMLTPGSANYMGGGGSRVSGIGTGVANGYPDYLKTYADLSGETGGFDPGTLSDLNDTIGKLKNTSGNYGATDTSISGLQNFAATGGVSADNISKIDNPTLEQFAQTGGYSDADKANIRARGNSAATANYQNLSDSLNKDKLVSGQSGPGWSAAGFKLARQGSQAAGDNAVNTEIGLNDSIRSGRLSAASTLADKIQALSGLQSQNTLAGYNDSGNLDLQKQGQVNQAMESSGDLDINKQGLINQTRLGAAGGLSNDYLGRASINSQASAANAGIDAANVRALLGLETGQEDTGLQGMLNTYGTAPAELMADQANTLNWVNSQTGSNQNLINSRIGVGNIPTTPDWMGTVTPFLNAGSSIVGGMMGGGVQGPKAGSGSSTGMGSNYFGGNLTGYNGNGSFGPSLPGQQPNKSQLMGY